MIIKRAVKSAGIREQLDSALEVAGRAGIHGIEIQSLARLIESKGPEQRAKIVSDACKEHGITSLSYHFPPCPDYSNFRLTRQFDLASNESEMIFSLTSDAIREACLVASSLEIKEAVFVVHLFGVVEGDSTIEERENKLRIGEARLLELKDFADDFSGEMGCRVAIARENSYPAQGHNFLIDYDPRDTIQTIKKGIFSVLDLSHLWLYLNYLQDGRNEFPGSGLAREVHKKIGFEEMIEAVAPCLKAIHISDCGPGYTEDNEGREAGSGIIPYSKAIPLLFSGLKNDIIGTYEILNGHLNPEAMFRSDQKFRQIFGPDFGKYFS